MKKHLHYLDYLRVLSVTLIFFCHVSANSSIIIGQYIGLVLNVGVEIFFLLSGFCLGLQGEIQDIKKWIKKRILRIYIPYELFLVALFFCYIIQNTPIIWRNWILEATGLFSVVHGSTHTWFITVILVCYCITPICDKLLLVKGKVSDKFIIFVLICLSILFCFIPVSFVSNKAPHVLYYVIAYICGRRWSAYEKNVNIKKSYLWCALVIIGMAVRFVSRFFVDGTVLYNVVVLLTQYLVAVAISALCYIFFQNKTMPLLLKKYCDISYEIYLVHYPLIVGPLYLLSVTNYFVINLIILFTFTIVSSICIFELGNSISGLGEKNRG